MNEDFLHYLWKHKKFELSNLKTTQNEELILQKVGTHNTGLSGPDFFDARLIINDQKWAGNVEIHLKSSDWYAHHHEEDPNYDNVILHVVWKDDVTIFRKDNTPIATLQLRDYISQNLLDRYRSMFAKKSAYWISCEKALHTVSDFVMSQWQERLYIERLEQKSEVINTLLKASANDWEAVLFKMLSKNFGLKVNSEAFLSLANSLDFSIIRKTQNDLEQLEALFFGQAGLIENDSEEAYVLRLQKQYDFLKKKFKLQHQNIMPFQFFRLRPANFPTIRIAQLASLYYTHKQLFSKIIQCNTIKEYYNLFAVRTSDFWKTHYTFDKTSSNKSKYLTKSFIDLLLINTVIPIKFLYAKNTANRPEEQVFDLVESLAAEQNSIVKGFLKRGVTVNHALHSQALIQLKNNYCDNKACLQCAVGNYLLNQ